MLNKFLAVLLSCITLLTMNTTFASNVSATTKATATLSSSCQIVAHDVLFGVIDPRTSSSGVTATSNMELFCSKSASYTINLAYGNANYEVYVGCPSGCPTNLAQWNTYNPSGTFLYSTFYSNSASRPNYGSLKGISSGENLSYKITIPGDDSKIWTRGNYSYTTTGNGASQSIPVKATLTTTGFPTPDNYSDIVTATVTF